MNASRHAIPSAASAPDAPEPGRPSFSAAEMPCLVLENQAVNSEYRHLVLQAPDIALAARPGQFFHLACPASGTDRPYLRRPMSLYRVDPAAGQVAFLYKVQGVGTRGLATLTPGDTLNIMGPVGHGFTLPPSCRHALILARGVGLATMAPLAEFAIARQARVTAVLSARSPELLMSVDYLEFVGARVITVNDTEGSSDTANIETLIRGLHAREPLDYLATCGSNRLLKLLQQLASEWQIPAEVALEQNMGCALGMCFACIKPFLTEPGATRTSYRRVCWDGPVFNVQETLSW